MDSHNPTSVVALLLGSIHIALHAGNDWSKLVLHWDRDVNHQISLSPTAKGKNKKQKQKRKRSHQADLYRQDTPSKTKKEYVLEPWDGVLGIYDSKESELVNALVQLGLGAGRWSSGTTSSRLLLGVEWRFVERLGGLRNVKGRVLVEETIWLQHNADTLHRHDGEVFNTRVVGKTEGCGGFC